MCTITVLMLIMILFESSMALPTTTFKNNLVIPTIQIFKGTKTATQVPYTVSRPPALLQTFVTDKAANIPQLAALHDRLNEQLVKKVRSQSIGHPNPNVGRKVHNWSPSRRNNPEELGSYLQGDVLLPWSIHKRQGISNVTYRWPRGIVYFELASNFSTNETEMIAKAMNEFHRTTCLQFQPYTGMESDFVSIEAEDSGCWSSIGRLGGMQIVNLQTGGCFYYIGSIMHELMHTIGFFHEHSRMERDNFLLILWNNIIKGEEYNFDKYVSTSFGVGYDYGSVMHYSKWAFSRNRHSTLLPRIPGTVIGQREGLSSADIEKINLMYKCHGSVSEL